MIKDFELKEIIDIINTSHTHKEALIKLGYKGYSSQNKILKDFCFKNNIQLIEIPY